MGVSYARNGLEISLPRVGLLNVGTEDHKGRAELHEAHELISQYGKSGDYKFVGFIEGGDIPGDKADVIVADGCAGNVALKTGEGTAQRNGVRLSQALRYPPNCLLTQLLAVKSLR